MNHRGNNCSFEKKERIILIFSYLKIISALSDYSDVPVVSERLGKIMSDYVLKPGKYVGNWIVTLLSSLRQIIIYHLQYNAESGKVMISVVSVCHSIDGGVFHVSM